MNVRCHAAKYPRWTSTLILSFCLLGTIGCGQITQIINSSTESGNPSATSEAAAPTETPVTSTTQLDLNQLQANLGDSVNLGEELEKIQTAYNTYYDQNKLQQNLLNPLEKIAAQPAESRNQNFIDGIPLDVEDVNNNLTTLQGAVTTLNSLATTASKTDQVRLLQQELETIENSINDIKTSLLEPLLSEQADPKAIFVNPDADIGGNVKSDVVRQVQDRVDELSDIPEEGRGYYGNATFKGIRNFLNRQNETIASTQVISADLSALSNGTDDPNSIPPTASESNLTLQLRGGLFVIGLVGGLGTLLWFLFRSRLFNSDEQRSPNRTWEETDELLNSHDPAEVTHGLKQAIYLIRQDLKSLQKQANSNNDPGKHLDEGLETKITKMDTSIQPLNAVVAQLQSQPTFTPLPGSGPSNQNQHPASSPQIPALSPAGLYYQQPSSFQVVSHVALSAERYKALWAGQNVQPIFTSSSQGDYDVITPDSRYYYIVLRPNTVLTTSNLETLKVLYDCSQDKGNLNDLYRHYIELAGVTSQDQGKTWALVQRGQLQFNS